MGAASAAPPSVTEGLTRSMLGLVVVVALIFVVGWTMKRVRPQGQPRAFLQVLGSTSVGTRERVVLVRYLDEVLVLGVAQGSVQLLKSGPLPSLPDPLGAASPSFLERLRGAMRSPT